MFNHSSKKLYVVINLEYGSCLHGSMYNVDFSYACGIARLGPMSSVNFKLTCKYCKVGPLSNVCFKVGMQVLQGWVLGLMCVLV